MAGRSYTVQYRDAAADGGWRKLVDPPVPAVSGPVVVPDPTPADGERFYRVVTPAQP